MIVPPWYKIAEGELGVEEIPGTEDNPRIVEYLLTVFDHKQHDEVAWCSAFVSWCMTQAGYHSTHSALARSWMYYGLPAIKPLIGDIIVIRRGKEAWMGHVGFYAGKRGDNILLLGGNQSNAVNISAFPASSVIAMRRPMLMIMPTGKIDKRRGV